VDHELGLLSLVHELGESLCGEFLLLPLQATHHELHVLQFTGGSVPLAARGGTVLPLALGGRPGGVLPARRWREGVDGGRGRRRALGGYRVGREALREAGGEEGPDGGRRRGGGGGGGERVGRGGDGNRGCCGGGLAHSRRVVLIQHGMTRQG
jgi:hypothetical protein